MTYYTRNNRQIRSSTPNPNKYNTLDTIYCQTSLQKQKGEEGQYNEKNSAKRGKVCPTFTC